MMNDSSEKGEILLDVVNVMYHWVRFLYVFFNAYYLFPTMRVFVRLLCIACKVLRQMN